MSSPYRDIPRASSPSRLFGTSAPRADATARLASPVPSHQFLGTPPAQPVNAPDASRTNGSGSNGFSSTPLAGAVSSSVQGPGVSALAAALSNSIGTSPPRHGTPAVRPQSPPPRSGSPHARAQSPFAATAQLSSTPQTNYGSFDTRSRNAPYEDPEIVKRHLVQATDAGSEVGSLRDGGKGKQTAASGAGLDDEEFSSLRLQGGDVTRGIYKWTEEAEAKSKMQRSKSFSLSRPDPENEALDISAIKVPGGFRRNYIRRSARSPSADPEGRSPGEEPQQKLLTASFMEFLSLYGHFAGEELEEDDEDLRPGEYFSSGEDDEYDSDEHSEDDREPMEDSALLTPSRRKRRRKVRGGSGKTSPMGAALLLLKSFVGTGVLFLPRAYLNGGMVFSNLILLAVAALSYHCFILLVSTRLKVEGSFGDLGGILYGKWMRTMILSSIVLSQIGFVAAYMVFTSESLQAFVLAVTKCGTWMDIKWFILIQMAIFLPFSLLRDIEKLGFTALIADAFILIGLAYLFYYDVLTLSTNGLADIIMFNSGNWTLFIGTAIFTFEGIGLIIPIQESMANPRKFPRVMFVVMIIITVLFITMGGISYAAYGSKTETVVLLNLPQDNKLVNGVQFLYSTAIMLSTPLQIFPAIKITENALFTKSGKYNPYIKWQKNSYRFLFVTMCSAIAWGGADNLDKFVALVGNFACIPLVFIYPPLLHLRAVAKNRFWRVADMVLTVFGFVAMGYTTILTVQAWANDAGGPKLPSYCDPDGKN